MQVPYHSKTDQMKICEKIVFNEDHIKNVLSEFQNNITGFANNLYLDLLDSWRNQLDSSNWLSRRAKNSAKQKLKTLSAKLGYSTFHENDVKILKYFNDLTIGGSYFSNTLNFINHSWKARIKNWGELVGSIERLNDPLELRATYSPALHTLYSTPVLLQSPLLDGTLPNYVTYGTVGFILAHEMSHTLDYQEIPLNQVPLYKDFSKMLTTTELNTYDEVVECFVHIYDNYFRMFDTIYGTSIKRPIPRAKLTRNENIADWNGLQIGFQAYKKMKYEMIPNGELKLPGFERYTDEQMFFISYAQSWCNENMEDDWTHVHSPAFLRVLGTVSNTADFTAAFNCTKTSPMNPQKKCNIWKKI